MESRRTLVAVVEDDPSMRHAIERLLRVSGMACIGYESAESFLAGQGDASPDFAVIDVNLDRADGLQLQARLRAEAPRLPVIVITGRHSEAVRGAALAQGCVAYMVKPFSGNELIDAIRRAQAAG
jgi:FixJ family two-component response regulator